MTAERPEELRIALVMNGGVSLAVWMGGVTNEIFRVITNQHPVYSRLLDMTRTTARVDVISGTSAGGVNGAALAIALLYGGEFSQLRDVWLQTGSFADLLRPPLGNNPGSLLMGEEFFLPHIREAFEQLAGHRHPVFTPDEMPLDLRLTTTLLTGKQGDAVDDLGIAVHDVDYRAHFRFRHDAAAQDFNDASVLLPLIARAARSTASFPFAFEPSRVADAPPGQGHLMDASDTLLDTPRYVVDGGILDNKPFRGALRSIFGMRAHGAVRRVLAYINPDPGDGAPGQVDGPMPSLASALSASVLGIPQSQTISDQLREIRGHNERVRTRRNSVVATVQLLQGVDLQSLPEQLFSVYRRRRLVDVFEGLISDDLPAAARRYHDRQSRAARRHRDPDNVRDGLALLGKHGREHLSTLFTSIDWNTWLPPAWPADATNPAYGIQTWQWGLFPVEFSVKVLLDLLRRAERLKDIAFMPAQGPPPDAADQDPGPPQAEPGDWSDSTVKQTSRPKLSGRFEEMLQRAGKAVGMGITTDTPGYTWVPEAKRIAQERTQPPPADKLADGWIATYKVIEDINSLRQSEQGIWDQNADLLLAKLNERLPGSDRPAGAAAVTPDDFLGMFKFLDDAGRVAACGHYADRIAAIVLSVCPVAAEICDRCEKSGRLRDYDSKTVEELWALVDYLYVGVMRPTPPSPQPNLATAAPATANLEVRLRLMRLEVVEFSFNNHDELSSDTLIELVQISGNSRSPLGGPDQAAQKLLGLQLAHFGAFYKQSWRANDWTYGRLDGSERMAKILLNPERLHRFYFGQAAVAEKEITNIAWKSIQSPVLHKKIGQIWADEQYESKLHAELAFLDDARINLPDALSVCAEVVTLRLHFGILREEIPQLLQSIATDRSQGSDALGAGETLLQTLGAKEDGVPTRPFSPEQAGAALKSGLIAKERLVDEAGSDLFTRTLAQTTATLQNLLASKAARLGPVSWLFASLKVPLLGFYFVARTLTRQSRTSAALHAGILGMGLVIVCLQFWLLPPAADKDGLPATVVTFGWAMLAYGLLMATIRQPRTVGIAILVLLLAAAYVVHTPGMLLIAGVILLVAISVKWAWVQWVIGFAMIGFAAAWASGLLPADPPRQHQRDVLALAGVVCGVLLIALWQTSPWSSALENKVRLFLRKLRNRFTPDS